jgi:hypothetical protein
MTAVRRGGINSYWPQNHLQRSVDGARESSSVERPGEGAVGGVGDCELLEGKTVTLGPYCCQVDGALNSRTKPRRRRRLKTSNDGAIGENRRLIDPTA